MAGWSAPSLLRRWYVEIGLLLAMYDHVPGSLQCYCTGRGRWGSKGVDAGLCCWQVSEDVWKYLTPGPSDQTNYVSGALRLTRGGFDSELPYVDGRGPAGLAIGSVQDA